jgi:hypothetical protein
MLCRNVYKFGFTIKLFSPLIKVPQWYAVQVSDTTMLIKEKMLVPKKTPQNF